MNQKTLVILVHGINAMDKGRMSVGKLAPLYAARNVDCLIFSYGFVWPIGATAKNNKLAGRLGEAVRNAKAAGYTVICVVHSNGADIIHRATTKYSADIDRVVLINPALDKNKVPGPFVRRLDVWHCPGDKAVKLAKFIPKHPWGEMGATGYVGNDTRVRNFNMKTGFAVSSNEHSEAFELEKLAYFGQRIVDKSLEDIKGVDLV